MEKTILIVDDFENTRKVIKSSLSSINHNGLMAENGEEALSFFDGRQIDLLITDLNMPKMNGIELALEVKKMAQYRFLPIIMLTTEIRKEKKEKAEEARVTAWIQKPFDQQDFLKMVNRCLR